MPHKAPGSLTHTTCVFMMLCLHINTYVCNSMYVCTYVCIYVCMVLYHTRHMKILREMGKWQNGKWAQAFVAKKLCHGKEGYHRHAEGFILLHLYLLSLFFFLSLYVNESLALRYSLFLNDLSFICIYYTIFSFFRLIAKLPIFMICAFLEVSRSFDKFFIVLIPLARLWQLIRKL